MLAGLGGGSGTTTYAENIGVMAATRVYSTAAYIVAGFFAILLSMCPKFGALIQTMPPGVLGGAVTVLYGLIVVLGGRIWVEAKVDFKNAANLIPAAIALIIGAGNYTYTHGNLSFNGIAIGAVAAIVTYQVMKFIGTRTGVLNYDLSHPPATPAMSVPPKKR
jgi:xanthine/uracil permease